MGRTIKINGVTLAKPIAMKTINSMTSFAGRFNLEFRDAAGTVSVSVGDEVTVLDGATLEFGGVMHNVARNRGKVKASGLDFTTLLMRVFVNEFFASATIDFIVKDLISKFAPGITVANVYSTSTTVTNVRFRNVRLYKALQELTKYDKAQFFVDETKDLHFDILGQTSSGVTLTVGTNAIRTIFQSEDEKLVNNVKVTGGREEYKRTEPFDGDGSTTTFTLEHKPLGVLVTVDGVEQIGFKTGFASGSFDYTQSFEQKQIIFESGSIPAAGSGNIIVEYTYTTPVIVQSQDDASIAEFNTYEEVVYDETINKKDEAQTLAVTTLEEFAQPKFLGKVISRLSEITAVDLGETVSVVDVSNAVNEPNAIVFGIEKNYYQDGERAILSVTTLTDSVLEVLAKLVQRTDAIEEFLRGDVEILSLLRSFEDEMTSDDDPTANLTISTRNVNNNFITKLLSLWHFNEGSGATAFDELGRNDGTITNAVFESAKSGSFGQALDFTASGSRVVITLPLTQNQFRVAYSISLWCRTSDNTAQGAGPEDQTMINIQDTSTDRFRISLNNSPAGQVLVQAEANNVENGRSTDSGAITDNTWQFVAVTWDGTASKVKIYIDGVQADTGDSTANPAVAGNVLGARDTTNGNFQGEVDDVRIYRKELTSTEVLSLFNARDDSSGYTWYFARPPKFEDPIFFGGGSGKFTTQSLANIQG